MLKCMDVATFATKLNGRILRIGLHVFNTTF